MSKFTLPAKVNAEPATKKPAAANEKKISEIINKGGSLTKIETGDADEIKNFNIKILAGELKAINALRAKLPKGRGKRLAISLHDWIVLAIQEKIARDSKKQG